MADPIVSAAASAEGQLLEIAAGLQALENVSANNPNNANNVTLTINTDQQIATINANIPLTQTIVGGKPTYEAAPYLVD